MFSRGYDVCIMAIDGTWRGDCVINAISPARNPPLHFA